MLVSACVLNQPDMAQGHGMDEWDEQSSGKQESPLPVDNKKCSAVRAGAEGRVMGSRRIFAPQFKLQVLDSYRQDADCKGNQRATARKYGIHRRQIQKWLQMENHLRSITGAVSDSAGGAATPPTPPTPPAPTRAATPTPLQRAPALKFRDSPALNLSCETPRLHGVGVDSSPAAADYTYVYARADSESRPGSLSPPMDKERDLPIKKRFLASSSHASDEEHEVDDYVYIGAAEDDEEEVDVDVDGTDSEVSSTATGEPSESALDYTSATLSKRRSFSLQFKLEVLDAFHNDPLCQGNQRATARSFSINRRQVQKWLGQEAELRDEAVSRGGLNRQRLGRWLDQDADGEGLCLDLSRKRKDADDVHERLEDADRKKMRLGEWSDGDASDARSTGRDSVGCDGEISAAHLCLVKQEMPSPRSVDAAESASLPEDWFRHQLHLAATNPFPFPPPLVFGHLPGAEALSYVPRLPLSMCADKGRPTYSLDLKLGALDLYARSDFQQTSVHKWLKHENHLTAHNNSAFLLNSYR